MTPNKFLEAHVIDILGMQIDYAFLRNSEGYPKELTGDVDLLVRQKDLKKIYRYYKDLNYKGVSVVQVLSKRSDLYVMLFFHYGGKRKFLVLEYFTGIVFRGQTIFDGASLLDNCKIDGIWRRLSDTLSVSYTFFHYVIYKGYLPSKYQEKLDIHGLDNSIVNSVMAFIGNCQTLDEKFLLLENTKLLQDQIKKRISRYKTILNYVSQLLHFRRKSLGCLLKVNPVDAEAVIDFADKYHLYRPTHRYILKKNRMLSIIPIWIIIGLGGLAILPLDDIPSPESVTIYFDEKIGNID